MTKKGIEKLVRDGNSVAVVREITEEMIKYISKIYVRDFDIPWRKDLEKGIRNHMRGLI